MFNRWVESDLLEHTADAGTGVIAFAPLSGGVLTDRYLDGLPADSRRGKQGESGRRWYDEQKKAGTWDKVSALNEIARARGQKMAQLAITWLLRDDRITSVLVGASKVEQVAQNIEAVQATPLTDEELDQIERVLKGEA